LAYFNTGATAQDEHLYISRLRRLVKHFLLTPPLLTAPKKLKLFLSDTAHSDNAVERLLTELNAFSIAGSYRLATEICSDPDEAQPV
jgi:hypothetical protein